MSPCPAFEELSALIDGDLDRDRELEVRRHLDSCEACRMQVNAVTRLKQAVGGAYAGQSPPPHLRRAVLAQRPKSLLSVR